MSAVLASKRTIERGRVSMVVANGVQMTGWDHEFAVPFINEGHFRLTDPGPLRAPVLDFSLRRDQALDLILETRTAPDKCCSHS
jgi:hypothetical protein